MPRTEFENLRVYQLAEEVADLAWKVVGAWEHLAKETVGIQFLRSADSMGANIAEGSGRGSPAEKKEICEDCQRLPLRSETLAQESLQEGTSLGE